MAYKDILVHLDNAARSDVRMKVAIDLAAQHGAHLAALYAMDLPSPAMFMGGTSVFDMQMADEILTQARDRAAETSAVVEQRFQEALRKNSVKGEWRRTEGFAAESVAIHARYSDLVIVGQSDPDHPTPGETHVPENVILNSGRPVLVVPYIGDVKPIGRTVLIGWKSGREAARAVNDAIPLLSHAKSVTVLAIDPEQGISEDGEVPAADISLHLARHGIAATAAHTVSGGIPDGDVLLNYVSDIGADLIIVGGYAHSRAREFVLGGVTRTLLETMTVPVLFSH